MAQKRSFCNRPGGCVTGRIHGLIEDASLVQVVASPLMVPGLLQTEEYTFDLRQWAVAAIGGKYDDLVEQARRRRRTALQQTVFDRDPPLQYTAIIDETIFLRPSTSEAVRHRQIVHLADLATRPHMDIRIVPLHGIPPCQPFTLVHGPQGTSVIFEEGEAEIVSDPGTIAIAQHHFSRLSGIALSREVSAEILAARARQESTELHSLANMYNAVL